jgi:hypothetical protein
VVDGVSNEAGETKWQETITGNSIWNRNGEVVRFDYTAEEENRGRSRMVGTWSRFSLPQLAVLPIQHVLKYLRQILRGEINLSRRRQIGSTGWLAGWCVKLGATFLNAGRKSAR